MRAERRGSVGAAGAGGGRVGRALAGAALAGGLLLAPAAWSQEWVPARTAELQALDKVTARVTVLRATVGQAVRFGTLSITVRACQARPPDEVPDAAAFIEVVDSAAPAGSPPAFRAWMLANAPAASMLEHSVYDLRILECR